MTSTPFSDPAPEASPEEPARREDPKARETGGGSPPGSRHPDGAVQGADEDWLAPYDYHLPPSLIADRPVVPRDGSRLLVLERATGSRSHVGFTDLPDFLRRGDLLVLNQTRVLRARVFCRLERTGRRLELLFSHPESETPPGATVSAAAAGRAASWIAMVGPSRRLRPGDRLLPVDQQERPPAAIAGAGPGDESAGVAAVVLQEPLGGGLWRVQVEDESAERLMARVGHIPLPPYLRRPDIAEDRDWYQTVFAREEGAVAAPTAGLHFTQALLDRLVSQGVAVTRVTLHVGPGTFLPVRADHPGAHRVLSERFRLGEDAAEAITRCRREGGRVVAVGTTTVRTLEAAARLPGAPSGGVAPGNDWTDLTIMPGHAFLAVDAMVTNFHLPRSSLLLLVAAFAGREQILAAYEEARDSGYRFYSYGDAMLIV